MNTEWFKNVNCVEDLKKEYKKLAMKHHPDMGGNTQDMQEINNEYDILFKKLKDVHSTADGKVYTSEHKTTETPEEFKNIINILITLEGINIELCGSWLWVTGNTKEHKETLKSLGFRWSKSKYAWYYHSADYKKTSKRNFTLNEIRELYGSEEIRKSTIELSIV